MIDTKDIPTATLQQDERKQQIVTQFSNVAYFSMTAYSSKADGYEQMELRDFFRGEPLVRDRYVQA